MPGRPPCELLPWDTEFFGFKVAQVARDVDADGITAADQWCRTEQVRVAYLQLPVERAEELRHAETLGFRFADLRLAFATDGPTPAEPVETGTALKVREHEASDTTTLEHIASTAHHDSRFYTDGRFPRDRCDALYQAWIRRSCTEADRRVLVAEHEGDVAGYLAYRADEQARLAVIELVGVEASHRGAGVGSALVRAGLEGSLRSVPRVEVVTQGRNLAAQRLYQRAGMITSSVAVWLHRWYDT
jgi:dTDP-4-amino-4,6-dideoxy-D-galactose acyltransferase